MYKPLVFALAPYIALSSFPSIADDELTFGGSIRTRYEMKSDFNFEDSHQSYYLNQLRLHARWQQSEKSQFFIELQDARIFAEDTGINEDARNSIFKDQLDIHQAYWQYQSDDIKVKLGRQKISIGDQRLVSSLEWVNTARVNEGIRVTIGDPSKRTVDIFATNLVSVNPNKINSQSSSNNRYFDSEFYGTFVIDKTWGDQELHYWWLLRENSDFGDEVHTFGARYLYHWNSWEFEAQGAIQQGDFNHMNHEAGFIRLSTTKRWQNSSFTFGYNHATGDDDPNDDDHKTFDNLYPLNHAYYGYMDLVALQNIHNLEAIYQRPLANNYKLRIAAHGFWLAETTDAWYNAGLAPNNARLQQARMSGADDYLGSELDVTLATKVWDQKIHLLLGLGVFEPGNYVDETGDDDQTALFGFLQAKYSF